MADRQLQNRLLTAAMFVALAIIGDRLLSEAAEHAVGASHFRLAEIYAGRVDADIVVFGNSRGVHSLFAPRLTDATCRPAFNASYNGFSLASMVITFQDYLERNRAPKFALLEASAGSGRDRSTYELRTFVPMSPRLSRFYRKLDPHYPVWSRITHLYHFDSELFLRSLFYLRRGDQDWSIEGRQISAAMIQEYPGLGRGVLTGLRMRVASLRMAVKVAKAAGVQPILYIAPYHHVVFERTPDLQAWLDEQASLRDLGVPLLDFSRAVPSDQHFADPLHLNRAGSDRLIEALLATPEGHALSACKTAQ